MALTDNHNSPTVSSPRPPARPPVYLIGAGPGDPELLTLKAYKAIKQAEVVLYDNLVSEPIRALFPATAELIYVGKQRHRHQLSQGDIEAQLVAFAQTGKRVVRVKGGDPLVFGRGSEELLALAKQGIDAEVIAGITAANGCGSSSEIPLTHRGLAQGCTFVTGHGRNEQPIDWSFLAAANHTLVFYMGLNALPQIRQQLCQHGMAANTPVALVENGCRPQQRLIHTSLEQMAHDALRAQLQSPTLIYVGAVTELPLQLAQLRAQAASNPSQFATLAKESA
ncbi:uroporphyrinogen-III C-methyltransferase [Ferrimonas senticii]|uniref:uroporphyrinogen-III C-methyltransferase n=1 Tax=Ferrimonas senticii TaxID=394566 RepID=UPI00040340E4|nr:uroporphyrinogen-III C-methyltransferase [Ferrimonas senticii]